MDIFSQALQVVERAERSHQPYELPVDAYEVLAETKSVSCPICHSSRAQRFHKCEPGYCYWQAMSEIEEAA
jgi:hypothetical protein